VGSGGYARCDVIGRRGWSGWRDAVEKEDACLGAEDVAASAGMNIREHLARAMLAHPANRIDPRLAAAKLVICRRNERFSSLTLLMIDLQPAPH
jgi:hypothetical protein